MGVNLVAAVWGLAEATLFVLVPDVWLTGVAVVRKTRAVLIACLYALAGALVGGFVMYGVGLHHPDAALSALDRLPAISPGMLERVDGELRDSGAAAVFIGPVKGTPYKIYAVAAARNDIGLLPFLAVSVAARLARFVLTALIAGAISSRLMTTWPLRRKLLVLVVFWVLFYAAYFSLMPN